jgi:VIT1/CCC1 family predicted Fe2+/Mn2+ transporter
VLGYLIDRARRMRRGGHSEAPHIPGGGIVRELVFGANDGLVAAFAVVSGVYGAAAPPHVVFLAGVAELIGGTIAMGLGGYLAVKSEREYYLAERRREEREVDLYPETERREVREIFRAKGFDGDVLDAIVTHVTAERGRWVDTMMRDELGLSLDGQRAPAAAGLATGLAYAFGASMPSMPYAVLGVTAAFRVSILLTLATLFFVGAAKTVVTGRSWWRAGVEATVIGALAAAATFAAGLLLAA